MDADFARWYLGLRRKLSLALASGHHDARFYTLGRLHDETILIEERGNGQLVSEAHVTRASVASIISKRGQKEFSKLTRRLNVAAKPLKGLFKE